MAAINWTGSTGNDTIRFATYGQPSTTNTYTFDALAGTDMLDMVAGNQYASKFISTNFKHNQKLEVTTTLHHLRFQPSVQQLERLLLESAAT